MWRFAAGAFCLSCMVAVAAAEPVVLISKDGYTAFSGELIHSDEEFYTLKTRVGEVKIPVADVRCVGGGCPAASPSSAGQERLNLDVDQKDDLFQSFLKWSEKNADPEASKKEQFESFLKWRKNNVN